MISFNDTTAASVQPKPSVTFLNPEDLVGVSFIIKGREKTAKGVGIIIAPVEQPFMQEKVMVTFYSDSFLFDQVEALTDAQIGQGISATFVIREGKDYTSRKDGSIRHSYKLAGVIESPAPWPDVEGIRALQMAEKAQRDAAKAEAAEKDKDFPF